MDILSYILGKKAGGGGGEAVLVNKDISANGTYNASSDSADGYKKVVVDVPNTYAAGDEGKVVSNGALVGQTSASYTANGTYDTTLIDSATVDVPSGYTADEFASGNMPYDIVLTGSDYRTDAFKGSTIKSMSAPNITNKQMSFDGCSNLESVYLPNLSRIYTIYMFRNCTSLNKLALPKAGTWAPSYFDAMFAYGCSNLEVVDVSQVTGLSSNTFNGCAKLKTIIMRHTGVVSAGNVNCFNSSPFASGGSGGDIYIPKSLYDHLGDGTANDYKAASNWSTIDGYGTITWHAIEGSYYETHYGDDTLISG